MSGVTCYVHTLWKRRIRMRDNSFTDIILVSFDYSNKDDQSILVVGRRRMNESVEIINAFSGEEAEELYNKLVGDKGGSNVNGL